MEINWLVVATIAGPLVALFAGAALQRVLERRADVITWLGHAAAVNAKTPQGQAFPVHTHAVVVRNAGKMPATNVRLGHQQLPFFSVFPDVPYKVEALPGGGSEIVFPRLVGNEQVTITYLYYPPLLWNQINTHIKSDQGWARVLTVLPTPQQPMWIIRIGTIVFSVGIVATLYLFYLLVRWWLWLISK
jgi:hypothetical protein